MRASPGRGDWVCAQITSKRYGDRSAVELEATDFLSGGLHRKSLVRPGKLFTASEKLFRRKAGTLTAAKHSEIVAAVVTLLQTGA